MVMAIDAVGGWAPRMHASGACGVVLLQLKQSGLFRVATASAVAIVETGLVDGIGEGHFVRVKDHVLVVLVSALVALLEHGITDGHFVAAVEAAVPDLFHQNVLEGFRSHATLPKTP